MPNQAWRDVHLGNLVIAVDRGGAFVEGRPVGLTYSELELLIMLARRAGKLVPREAFSPLLSLDPAAELSRKLDVHICRLRQKIRDSHPWEIRTIRKRGYMLQMKEQTGNSLSQARGEHGLTRSIISRGAVPLRQP